MVPLNTRMHTHALAHMLSRKHKSFLFDSKKDLKKFRPERAQEASTVSSVLYQTRKEAEQMYT